MKYLFLIVLMFAGPLLSGQAIPQDAKFTCKVDATKFDQWFQSGKYTLDGVVNPADSVHFQKGSGCYFYEWAKQMFLWVTSPSGKSRVFDSSVFYDVSAPDSNDHRTFHPHDTTLIANRLVSRLGEGGPHGLPLIENTSGELFEEKKPDASGKQIVVDSKGNKVEVGKAVITGNKLTLYDRSNKQIELPSASGLRSDSQPAKAIRTVQKFSVNGTPVFADTSGEIIKVEPGQAGSFGVLESQKNGLVYYLTMTNDVYAYFLTGVKNRVTNGHINNGPIAQFPTTQADLDAIQKYASEHGKSCTMTKDLATIQKSAIPGKSCFTDANALAVELKSSWIDVTNLPQEEKDTYITTTAMIPTYDKSDPTKWIPKDPRPATLGLVGLHIVGSVAGHPEMIWATFERFGNTPNATYSYYKNGQRDPVPVPQDAAGTWEFSSSKPTGMFNEKHMKADDEANIIPENGFSISPSDSLRMHPWGGSASSSIETNTDLISIQNSISKLMPDDIRSNYFLVGATWMLDGSPNLQSPDGARKLANSTMETYTQQLDQGCFSCHKSSKKLAKPPISSWDPYVLSHIFGELQPLPATQGNGGQN